MKINLTLEVKPFMLPNYIQVEDNRYDVGELSHTEALQLWEKMEIHWLDHVANRRHNLEIEKLPRIY